MSRSLLAALCLAAPSLADSPRVDQHGDPLPDGAIARFGTVRYRIGQVGPYALSPDAKTLAAEIHCVLTLWDVATGRPRVRIPVSGHHASRCPYGPLAFSPDGKHLVRVFDKDLCIYDAATGRQRMVIELPEPGWGVRFFPGSSRFAVTQERETSFVYDVETGRQVETRKAELPVWGLSPGGTLYLGGSKDELVLVDAATGKARGRVKPELLYRPNFAVSRDDQRMYAITPDCRLMTFDTRTGKKLEQLDLPPGWKPRDTRPEDAGIALSPDGDVAYLWNGWWPPARRDLKAGKWLDPLPHAGDGRLIPHPDGKLMLFLGEDGVLRRYDLTNLKELPSPDGFVGQVDAVPSPDGRWVAARVGGFGTPARLNVFDPSGRLRWSMQNEYERVPGWSPDGRWLIAIDGPALTLRDPATGKLGREFRLDPGQMFGRGAAIVAGGDRLIAPHNRGEAVAVFDVRTGARTSAVPADLDVGGWPAVSPDGTTIAVGSLGRGVTLIDVATGKVRVPWTDPPPGCKSFKATEVLFSPDGSFLLDWDEHGVAVLRDPVTGERKRTIHTSYTHVWAFDLSPDGLWLATGSSDGMVALWDLATGRQVWARGGHAAKVTRVGFAGAGRLVSSSWDLTALLWDLKPDRKPTKPLWDALSGDDGLEAYTAIWALAADPAGPELLRTKLSPAKRPAAADVRRWIADLGADKFAVREAATKTLRDQGRAVDADLRAARETATAEARRRLEGLLADMPRERNAVEVAQARAVAALELATSDAAKKVLAEWAAGAPEARLTVDAKSALERMATASR